VSQVSTERSERGVYGISVAAELSGVGPQTLRLYEERGLLRPTRSAGGTRRYSDDDLIRLQRITALLAKGVNVAGIGHILDLQDRNTELESHNLQLISDNSQLKSDNARLASLPDSRPDHRAGGQTGKKLGRSSA
jgi:MerR family transcriptional regulator/heat shock protein HspR